MINEQLLKVDVSKACNQNNVESYILLFVDGSKMKSIANVEMSELAPLLMQAMLTKKK